VGGKFVWLLLLRAVHVKEQFSSLLGRAPGVFKRKCCWDWRSQRGTQSKMERTKAGNAGGY
jgi:hypothetical protein